MLNLLTSDPLIFFVWVVVVLASLSFHEFAHAFAAWKLGDDTAKDMGRLTLNPLKHIDPIGLLAFLFVGFGWAKPVPFNPYNLRNAKWGPSIVAAAGPLANLILVVVSGLILRLLLSAGVLAISSVATAFLVFLVQMNVILFLFNLIPVTPLDGSKFLLAALDKPRHFQTRRFIETNGMWLLLGLILVDQFVLGSLIFGKLFGLATSAVFALFGLA